MFVLIRSCSVRSIRFLSTALHGNEVSGIPLVQKIFHDLCPYVGQLKVCHEEALHVSYDFANFPALGMSTTSSSLPSQTSARLFCTRKADVAGLFTPAEATDAEYLGALHHAAISFA